MAEKIKIGLAGIKIGNIGADGAMGTALAPLGTTLEDSCKINFEDGEETEFKVEEHDNPIYVQTTQGSINIEFSIAEYDLNTIVKVMGGSVAGNVYKAPTKTINIEQSLQIENQVGVIFKFPRVKITAKFSSDLGKKNLLTLDVKATVLNPTKDGEGRFSIENKA